MGAFFDPQPGMGPWGNGMNPVTGAPVPGNGWGATGPASGNGIGSGGVDANGFPINDLSAPIMIDGRMQQRQIGSSNPWGPAGTPGSLQAPGGGWLPAGNNIGTTPPYQPPMLPPSPTHPFSGPGAGQPSAYHPPVTQMQYNAGMDINGMPRVGHAYTPPDPAAIARGALPMGTGHLPGQFGTPATSGMQPGGYQPPARPPGVVALGGQYSNGFVNNPAPGMTPGGGTPGTPGTPGGYQSPQQGQMQPLRGMATAPAQYTPPGMGPQRPPTPSAPMSGARTMQPLGSSYQPPSRSSFGGG